MKILRKIIIYGGFFVSLFFLWNEVLRSPCSKVIEYDIGSFDERFEISKNEFITQIELAEIPWEEEVEKNLFRYVKGSDFKINLIWSEEQERLYKGNSIENKLNNDQDSIGSIQDRYDTAVNRYERAIKEYEAKLNSYEEDVIYWNNKGGAPRETYLALQNEEQALERKIGEINRLLEQVNKIAEENNQKIKNYNSGVEEYNNLFSQGHEFDAGNTDGREINVYTYDGNKELRALLIHEFGHVLGINHVDDQNSIMFYLLNKENKEGELTEIDIKALELSCKL